MVTLLCPEVLHLSQPEALKALFPQFIAPLIMIPNVIALILVFLFILHKTTRRGEFWDWTDLQIDIMAIQHLLPIVIGAHLPVKKVLRAQDLPHIVLSLWRDMVHRIQKEGVLDNLTGRPSSKDLIQTLVSLVEIIELVFALLGRDIATFLEHQLRHSLPLALLLERGPVLPFCCRRPVKGFQSTVIMIPNICHHRDQQPHNLVGPLHTLPRRGFFAPAGVGSGQGVGLMVILVASGSREVVLVVASGGSPRGGGEERAYLVVRVQAGD
ncbi:hypothetical protein C4D60_Mb09t23860 [Musa balbisiana]|uniref:Uncharacterized protein n=1 Tax=Musa balbisiana TaxID=52838 RepID=A0A4S8IIQ1_MUSBA|nr:hypothetical protein C4D60_Mb09t23860 [Musa balbisiana]